MTNPVLDAIQLLRLEASVWMNAPEGPAMLAAADALAAYFAHPTREAVEQAVAVYDAALHADYIAAGFEQVDFDTTKRKALRAVLKAIGGGPE
jgi:hypothetical protein